MTGGVPANFGDATGDHFNYNTWCFSCVFRGVEAVSSGIAMDENVYGLDNNAFNLFEATLSGPLLMKDSNGKRLIQF